MANIVQVCGNRGHHHDPFAARIDVALRSVARKGGPARSRGPNPDLAPAVYREMLVDGYNPYSTRGEALWYDYDSIRHWPNGPWGEETKAGAILEWREAGVIYVGWYEHVAPGRKDRGTGNIFNGYLTRTPPKGVQWYSYLLSYDHKRRTARRLVANTGNGIIVPVPTSNIPPFVSRRDIPPANYKMEVPQPDRKKRAVVGQFKGIVVCNGNAECTNTKYDLRSWFHQRGYNTGTPVPGNRKSGMINVNFDPKKPNAVTWGVNP